METVVGTPSIMAPEVAKVKLGSARGARHSLTAGEVTGGAGVPEVKLRRMWYMQPSVGVVKEGWKGMQWKVGWQ